MSSLTESRWLNALDLPESRSTRRSFNWPLAISVAVAGVAAAGLSYYALQSRRRVATLDDERLKEVLSELTRQFYVVCRDVAQVSRTVRSRIQTQGLTIHEDDLREQMKKQCMVFEKLQEIQSEVTAKFGCSVEDVQIAQARAAGHADPEMQAYCNGFKTMLDDALEGRLPVLPNLRIPEGLTQEKVLEIERRAQTLEVQKLLLKVGSNSCNLQELGEIWTKAHNEGVNEAIDENKDLIPGGPDQFQAVLAKYLRDGDFSKEKLKSEEEHQKRLVKLLQPGGVAGVKQ